MMKRFIIPFFVAMPLVTACNPPEFHDTEQAVKYILNDPESAQFRQVRRCDKPDAVQGEVNARNALGGYTGFKPFIHVAGVGAAILGDGADLGLWDELTRKCWSDRFLKESDAARGKDPDLEFKPDPETSVPDRKADASADQRPMSLVPPDDSPEIELAQQPQEMCWQDYCPCDPPQGGPDQFLCRRLKAGLTVDEEQLSIGAGMRDARQQLADFEAEHGSFDE